MEKESKSQIDELKDQLGKTMEQVDIMKNNTTTQNEENNIEFLTESLNELLELEKLLDKNIKKK